VPSILLAAWWILADPTVEHGTSALTTDAVGIAVFVVVGIIGSLGALTGLGLPGGILLAVATIALVAWQLRRGRRPVDSIGPLAGLVALFGFVAVSRGILGLDAATSSRYVYFGAILVILVLAPLLPDVAAPPRWPRGWVRVALIAALEIAVLGNALLLVAGRDALAREAVVIRAEFALLDDPGSGAAMSTFVYRDWTPAPPRLIVLRRRHGDLAQPAGGVLDPPSIPGEVIERVRTAMRTGRLE
jgi:hypothetical protein